MITIVVGTNRKNAISYAVGLQYKEILAELGKDSQIVYLNDLPTDYIMSALYENAGKNVEFNRIRETMNASEKFVFVIPEYNGSFPGILKAFVDGLDRAKALTNKKCALVGISAGDQGAGLALSHFTDILNYCGTNVLAYRLRIPKILDFMTDNRITEESYILRLKKQAQSLLAF